MAGFTRLQGRLILATAALTAVVVVITAFAFGFASALSLLVGGLAGMLYLRLLARSVANLGGDVEGRTRKLGKTQLLVPVVLVLMVARLPQLAILPALLGFLLYKPALILQAVFDT